MITTIVTRTLCAVAVSALGGLLAAGVSIEALRAPDQS
jgi:hypothetical protein